MDETVYDTWNTFKRIIQQKQQKQYVGVAG